MRLSGVFTNLETGAAVDPALVTFIYKRADEERLELVYGTDDEVVREEPGVYHVDLVLDDAGIWHYRWESGENWIGVAEGQVTVLVSSVE